MKIAIIPARGGSKRIPRKNIKEFCGKPMIAWPIETAIKSKLFNNIIVSTDDDEIADISKLYGAATPFIRPTELSGDYVGIVEVVKHAIEWMHEQKYMPEAICCIYPTSVFFNEDDLKKGSDALFDGDWAYTFTVTDFEYPIFRSFKKNTDGGVEMFFPEYFNTRSQDLPTALHDAAQFYWGRPNSWIENLKIYDICSYPIMIPRWRIQDIDTEDDWKRAELLFQMISKKN